MRECQPQRLIHLLAQCLMAITPISLAIAIILYSVDLYRHGNEEHYVAWFSAGGFVLITFPISVYLIVQHLLHWSHPNIQKYVVRIVGMIPIYSIESWFSLRFRKHALIIETFRECYEAYVIYCFLYYLISLVSDNEQQIIQILKQKSTIIDQFVPIYPFHLLFPTLKNPSNYLNYCKLGVFQYILMKTICSILIIIMEHYGIYHEGRLSFTQGGYLSICLLSSISQLWALYSLTIFYLTFKEELSPWKPVGKFLSVKMVIFFTWWQSLLINIACSQHWITDTEGGWTINEINKGLQDYLICIEMFFAAVAFNLTFSHKDYLGRKKDRKKDFIEFSSEIESQSLREFPSSLNKTETGEEDPYERTKPRTMLSSVESTNTRQSYWSDREGEENHSSDENEFRSETVTLLSNNHNNDNSLDLREEERQRKHNNNKGSQRELFFSALWQSSLPDDVVADIRKFTSLSYFQTDPSSASSSSSFVGEESLVKNESIPVTGNVANQSDDDNNNE